MKKKIIFAISVVPALGSLVVINRIEPYVLGMPFVLFWAILWVCLTSLFLIIANKLDPSTKEEEE
ncbi:DUF3311 domain-containing protein [Peribacillus sp. R9-11]|uniref:DUF3311 domain-containing protein n=1 Tax=Peribacillus sp. R9-11 TaxID=3073271 RepID=UPI002868F258|nr:DUF3311 domain-containing protein [Peribacillus sp. R9-11]WMX53877.1 DUF3311 domain-containing protein [Peribacillus sp. R9-11]